MTTPNLDRLTALLRQIRSTDLMPYHVPGCWVGAEEEKVFTNGAAYILHQIAQIKACKPTPTRDLAYNALIRHVTSYPHYGEESTAGPPERWRTTGTFLKFIALIPYLKSIGVTQVVLLPIFSRGVIGRKGTIGSPYAVRNPFAIDDDLAEPCVVMTAQEQAQAMVEALHLAGIRVVLEVVLRTASLDSELVEHGPHWFYWMKQQALPGKGLSAPEFSSETLEAIHNLINGGSRTNLPVPDSTYREMFATPPREVVRDTSGWLGRGDDHHELRIPGAFADWPPDDPQPAWSDVTYLRLHNHPEFLYPAYNTIRMFDERLEHHEYRQHDLWNLLAQIIPHYQWVLNIDGAMIDMGHALPLALRHEILAQARDHHPGFVVYEECFELNGKLAEQGVNAVMGYLPHVSRTMEGLRAFVGRCSQGDLPIAYFAAADSHNTPRIASTYNERNAFAVWRFISLLPRAIPFIVAGFELGEIHPVNTGLDFTDEQARYYQHHGLPLFDDMQLPWNGSSYTRVLLQERLFQETRLDIIRHLQDDDEVHMLQHGASCVLSFMRRPKHNRRGILVCVNTSTDVQTIIIDRTLITDTAVSLAVTRLNACMHVQIQPESCLVLPVLTVLPAAC